MEPQFRFISDSVYVFDVESVPDVDTINKVYGKVAREPYEATVARAYKNLGLDFSDPNAMLKPMFQKIVSISVLIRKNVDNEIQLYTRSLSIKDESEAQIIEKFLSGVGLSKNKETMPIQLVGFASSIFDIPILCQRAMINQLNLPFFFSRPEKPWEGVDYFAKGRWNVDLMYTIGYHQPNRPKLSEITPACNIPGKIKYDGSDVKDLYVGGKIDEIIYYNQLDVISTYLLWLRVVHTFGYISTESYIEEQALLKLKMEVESESNPYFNEYLKIWESLNNNEEITENNDGTKETTKPSKGKRAKKSTT